MKYIYLSLLCLTVCCRLSGQTPEATPPLKPKKIGPAAAEFQKISGQWKTLIAELGILHTRYRTADDTERKALEKTWDGLIARGTSLEPQLIAAAEKAFLEEPNADKQITDLLRDFLANKVEHDDAENARRIGGLLIDHRNGDKTVYALTGSAAAAMGDLAAAEKYLRLAQKEGFLDNKNAAMQMLEGFLENKNAPQRLVDTIAKYSAELENMKKNWETEQKIRQKEAAADDLPRVLIKTNKGDIEVELFENEAPNTVANFIALVDKGFYNGLTFHRVIPGFVAQGGDPKGDGSGGPGYSIACECYRPDHRLHYRGSLSMAHAGKDTGGSQFFICFAPTDHLDGKHTVFGRVMNGFEVLAKIQRRDPQDPNAPDPDKIVEMKVMRKRDHEYQVKKIH